MSDDRNIADSMIIVSVGGCLLHSNVVAGPAGLWSAECLGVCTVCSAAWPGLFTVHPGGHHCCCGPGDGNNINNQSQLAVKINRPWTSSCSVQPPWEPCDGSWWLANYLLWRFLSCSLCVTSEQCSGAMERLWGADTGSDRERDREGGWVRGTASLAPPSMHLEDLRGDLLNML